MRCARAEFQDAAVSAIRAFRHTRVDQCKRHLHTHTNVDQRRPYFRINHHAQRRPVTRQKTLDRKWHVIRQIATQRARQKALLPSRGRSASYASSRREYADERQAMLQQAAARRASRRRILHVPTAAAQDRPADGPAHRQSVRRYGAHIACCAARATANASPHMERRSTIRRDRKNGATRLYGFVSVEGSICTPALLTRLRLNRRHGAYARLRAH